MSDTIEFDKRKLDQLIKALKGKLPVARVGVLAGKTQRQDGDLNNATIGAKHEFGDPSEDLPVRSFLRVPISEKMQKYLEKSGAFTEDALKKVIQDGSIYNYIQKFGIVGEAIVQDAFDSGGFGQWKPSIMKFKKTKQTLVETQQLRKSITSEVKE